MGNVIERLLNAGLEAKFFYSCQRDEIYVKVRAELKRLKTEASRINYRLKLDPDRLRAKSQLGKKRQGWLRLPRRPLYSYLLHLARRVPVEAHRHRRRVQALKTKSLRVHLRGI